MRSRGFSLLELVVLMALVSILLGIATLNFKEYLDRSRTEAQTRFLYGQLLKARVNAVCQRRTVRVKIYPSRFEVYSSQLDKSSGAEPLQTNLLRYPITCSRGWDPAAGFNIDFERDGLSNQNLSVCLEPNGTGGVNSITIFSTRVSIGKKDQGDDCDSDNITTQ